MKNTMKKIMLISIISSLIFSMTGCVSYKDTAVPATTAETTVVEMKADEAVEEPEEIEREKTGYAEDGSKYEYFYDEKGVLISGNKYSPDGILEISFDIDGETISNIFYNPDGTVSQTAITSSGEEVKFIEKVVFGKDNTYEHLFYNENGNVGKRVCYNAESVAVSEEEFDEDGRIVKFSEIREDGTYETDYQMTYDENGTSELKQFNDDGSYDIYLFDKSERQHRVTNYDADGNEKGSIRFDYDEKGNLVMTSTYDKNGRLSFYRINQYDENGELESQTKYRPDGRKY